MAGGGARRQRRTQKGRDMCRNEWVQGMGHGLRRKYPQGGRRRWQRNRKALRAIEGVVHTLPGFIVPHDDQLHTAAIGAHQLHRLGVHHG